MVEHGRGEVEVLDAQAGWGWGGAALVGKVGEEFVELGRGLPGEEGNG